MIYMRKPWKPTRAGKSVQGVVGGEYRVEQGGWAKWEDDRSEQARDGAGRIADQAQEMSMIGDSTF